MLVQVLPLFKLSVDCCVNLICLFFCSGDLSFEELEPCWVVVKLVGLIYELGYLDLSISRVTLGLEHFEVSSEFCDALTVGLQHLVEVSDLVLELLDQLTMLFFKGLFSFLVALMDLLYFLELLL